MERRLLGLNCAPPCTNLYIELSLNVAISGYKVFRKLLSSHSVMSKSLQPHGLQHARLHCPSLSPRVCSNSCHWVSDAIQPSDYLLPASAPTLNLSQHQGLFQWVSSSHQVTKVLELQLQHQSFQWIFRVDFLWGGLVFSPWSPKDSQESSPTPQFESINCSALSLPYGPTLTSIHDYWKNHSFDYMDLCWQSNVSVFDCLSLS